MRTTNKQGHHVGGERVAAVTVRQTLRNLGVKEFPGNIGGWRNRPPLLPASGSYAIRLLDRLDSDFGLVLQSSNEVIESPQRGIGGYAGILPIEHPAAISYISSCGPDHHLIYVSPQLSRLGFMPEEMLGKPDLRLKQVHEEDYGHFEQALRESCNAAAAFSCQYRIYDNQSKVRWFHDEASVVCDEAGNPLFIKGVMLDITDKKRMEIELVDHRYCLERNVEQRTALLLKRNSLLESCNASLGDQLSQARLEIAALKQQLELLTPAADCSPV